MSFYGILEEKNDKSEQELESINEGRVCYTNSIAVAAHGDGYTDRGYENQPYFKVYNNQSISKATKECRILFSEARYVYHDGKDRKDNNWILNSSERKELDDLLNFKSNWPNLINEANQYIHDKNKKIPLTLPKPDYRSIKQ